MSDISAEDRFAKVIGPGRGITDPNALRDRLVSAVAEVRLTETQLREAEQACLDMEEQRDALSDALRRADEDVASLEAELTEFELNVARLRFALHTARYATVRLGGNDPWWLDGWLDNEHQHQGVWTPGRPYLSLQHVFHPDTGDCYGTDMSGIPAGIKPGDDDRWRRCQDTDTCPQWQNPEGNEHTEFSASLRQTTLWRDRDGDIYRLDGLGDEHLDSIIQSLNKNAARLYRQEHPPLPTFAPCPVNAFENHGAWLADTPLMRALLAERKRRK